MRVFCAGLWRSLLVDGKRQRNLRAVDIPPLLLLRHPLHSVVHDEVRISRRPVTLPPREVDHVRVVRGPVLEVYGLRVLAGQSRLDFEGIQLPEE